MLLTGSDAIEYFSKSVKHFKPKEFVCPCCQKLVIDTILLGKLDQLRELTHSPLVITSGYRCKNHNEEVKGVEKSPHMLGFAADISCKDSSYRFHLLELLFSMRQQRIGIGKNFIHIDTATGYPSPLVWHYYGASQ